MNYNVKTIPTFERGLKKLAKKYLSLKSEYVSLIISLKENPEQGVNLGNNCYKIRLAIASKGKGKRNGARVITNFMITAHTVYLLAIYDKSEQDNLTNRELKELLKEVPK